MDIKKRVEIELVKLAVYVTKIKSADLGEAVRRTADQIIPLVRADMQKEIGKWLEGIMGDYYPDEIKALKSGTFKQGE